MTNLDRLWKYLKHTYLSELQLEHERVEKVLAKHIPDGVKEVLVYYTDSNPKVDH